MEYFKVFGTYIVEFSYWGQVIILISGVFFGYLLYIVEFEEICVEGMDIKSKEAATSFKDAIKKCDTLVEIW